MCNYSFPIKDKEYIDGVSIGYSHHLVPCGQCPDCIKKRSTEWSLRLRYHMKTTPHCHFITLTYASPPRTHNELFTLQRSDLVKFWKRLRKLNGEKISYYAIGEYGELYQRPHYHAIVFGVPDQRNFFKAWQIDGKIIGHVHVGTVTNASIQYVTHYTSAKLQIPQYDYDDRLPEFSNMSKGLGLIYVDIAGSVHRERYLGYTHYQHLRLSLPRYLKEKIFDKNSLKLISYENYNRYLETEAARTPPDAMARAKSIYEAYKAAKRGSHALTRTL